MVEVKKEAVVTHTSGHQQHPAQHQAGRAPAGQPAPSVPPPPPGMMMPPTQTAAPSPPPTGVPGNPTQPPPEGTPPPPASAPSTAAAAPATPEQAPASLPQHDPRGHLRRTEAGLKYDDTRYNHGMAHAQHAMQAEQDKSAKT